MFEDLLVKGANTPGVDTPDTPDEPDVLDADYALQGAGVDAWLRVRR